MSLEISMQNITRENLPGLMPHLLTLESNWTGIGEQPWPREKFEANQPAKWDMSRCAWVDGKVAGYFIGAEDGKTGKLVKVLTDSDFRGRGVADRLWQEFLGVCRERGLEKAEFKVLVDNYPAINFYKKHGCFFNGNKVFGTDNQWRYLINYVFHLDPKIESSKPTISSDDNEAVLSVLNERKVVPGEVTDRFVQEISSYVGRSYGVATNSGTSALHLALRSLGVGKGDKVLFPSYVCYSILSAVESCGATPVPVDINSFDYNISPSGLKRKVDGDTKAVIVPHMFGKPVHNLESFLNLGIPVIEDCAQSIGAEHGSKKVGSFGDVSIFSFKATKMVATGVGGMVLTNDRSIADKLASLTTYDNRETAGECYNYKMSDLQAAFGLSQLKKLQGFVARRREIAERYTELFEGSGVDFVLPSRDDENIFFRYIINHPNAAGFIEGMRKRGVDVARPVFRPLHSYLGLPDSSFPNTASAYDHAVLIPLYPSLTDKDVDNIASAVINSQYEK